MNWTVFRRAVVGLCFALLVWSAAPPLEATSVIPITDQELTIRADVIVHGVVISSDVTVDSVGRPETLTVIDPLVVVKGRLTGSLVLHQLGGILPDGRGLQLWGRPEYAAGREVVVFAIARPEGEYQTAEMLLGKFEVCEDSAGTRFAVPDLAIGVHPGVDVGDRRAERRLSAENDSPARGASDGPASSATSMDGARELNAFLEALSLGTSTRASLASPAGSLHPVSHSSDRFGRAIPQWGNISNQLWRWTNNATAAWTLVNSANMTGGGSAEAIASMASWTNDPNSAINYTQGSGTSNTIDLNAGSSGCGWSTCLSGGGVIGCGGPSGGGSNSWRGDSYITISQGFVQLRSYCAFNGFDSVTTQSVLTHELGHTLGLGHSDQNVSPHDICRGDESAATMRSVAQYRTTLGTDDLDAVRWIYGDGLSSCSAPPAAPTIATVDPGFGPTGGGTLLTISGANFVAGATISIGGAAATGVTIVNSTTVRATAPAHAAGAVSVVVTNPDLQSATASNAFSYNSGTGFYTLTPCRVLDTRTSPGPLGAPALTASANRSFVITGSCGVPATARSVSANVTVTGATAGGFVTVFPGGTPVPIVSMVDYSTGQTRANSAILSLGSAGDVTVRCGQASGTANFLIDVNGYFQ